MGAPGVSGGALASVLRFILFIAVMWLGALNVAPAAHAGQEMCSVPANACGCLTCGCTGSSQPREPSCPAGQVLYDDFCLPACPDGWQRYPGYPGVCLPPCRHGCPDGYDQVPLPQCPDGYHRDLRNPNYCVPDFDDPGFEDECPAGMVLSPETQRCVVECPEGTYASEDGLCRSYYERECPQGFGRDPDTGRCVPPGLWPPGYDWICLPHCPDGYVRDMERPTRCIPPPAVCPEGFERNGNGRCEPVCEEGNRRDPYGYCVPERCPDGTYPDLRGRCQQPDCPQGFDNIRGQCLPHCEEGYGRDENGRCVPPDEDCPPDYRRDPQSGSCLPPDDGCTQGEELFRGQCVPPCGKGTVRDNNGRCVPTGCPPGLEKLNGQCQPKCDPPRERDGKGRCLCPKGTEAVQGACLPLCRQGLERNANGRCACPAGTDFFGGRCVPECKQGLVRDGNGRCMPPACAEGEERVQGRCLPQCKAGFVRGSNGRCVCPRGTEFDRASGRCEKPQQPRECPEGFRRDDNGECQRIVRVPQGCPEGYRFSKRRQKCVPEEPEAAEPPPIRINPEIFQQLVPQKPAQDVEDCPRGYVRDNNGRCVKG